MRLSGNPSKTCNVLLLIAIFSVNAEGAPPVQRLHSSMNDGETYVLKDNTRPVVVRGLAQDEGKVRGSQIMPRMSLHFTMTAAQRADLDQLLKAQQDRRSPQYHKFLTLEDYAARFGMNSADIDKVVRWLENSGFADLDVARGRNWVSFSGTAAKAEAAFHISVHRYSLRDEMHFANVSDPRLPKALEGIVESLRGLHNFALRPHIVRQHPDFTAGGTGDHFLAPFDWATIYDVQPLYGAGLDGTGVKIAVVGQSDVAMTDIQAFRSAAGLSAKSPTVVIPPGTDDPGFRSGDESESDLDLEWSGAIAKNADILFITASATTGNGVEDSVAYAINNNVAPILSISYGLCEPDETPADFNTQNSLFQQAVSQGMTIVAASGDIGAATCDTMPNETTATHGLAVSFPASSPYVTGVGGTEFSEFGGGYWTSANNGNNGSALSYIPEVAWNEGFQAASGGGASSLVAKPGWQTGFGVPNDSARDVPDIAFTASSAHDGLLICSDGHCINGFLDSSSKLYIAGGTSGATPAFAGVLALVIQAKGAGSRLGNINPNLYSLAQISANAFHDITSSNNKVPCQTGSLSCANGFDFGFAAGAGYDQVTGLGSLDVYNFAQQWYGDIQINASPTELTIQPGTSATATVTVTPQNNFSGNVSFTCSVASSLVDVTCSVPGTVNTSGTATVTITAASTARMPLLKRFPELPPLRLSWLLIFLTLLTLSLFLSHTQRFFHTRAAYAFSAVSLFAIAMGAVSCGSGSSAVSPASGSAPITAPTPLSLACNVSNYAATGYAFSGNCSASGGTAPFNYSISAGTLPAGLTIDASTGAITGIPTIVGTGSFTVEVSDSGSPAQTATQVESNLAVAVGELTLKCNIGNGTVGVPYTSGSCTAIGGTSPFTYSLLGRQLLAGLTLNPSTGAITGTPTTVRYFWTSIIQVTDSESPQQTAQTNIIMSVGDGTSGSLGLMCTGFLGANVGVPFTGSCSPYNGTSPYTYSVSAGALPPGLSMTSSGAISGSPTVAGTSAFTITVVDSSSPPLTGTIQMNNFTVGSRLFETGLVTVVATAGDVVNTTTISVTVP